MNIKNSQKSANLRVAVIALAFASVLSLTSIGQAQSSLYFFDTGVTDYSFTGINYNQPTGSQDNSWYVGLSSTTFHLQFTFENNDATVQGTVQGLPSVYSFMNFGMQTGIGSDAIHDITFVLTCNIANGDSLAINNITINAAPLPDSMLSDQTSPSHQILFSSSTQITSVGYDITWQTLANANSGIAPSQRDLSFTMIGSATPVPEPTTIALFGSSLLGIMVFFRNKK